MISLHPLLPLAALLLHCLILCSGCSNSQEAVIPPEIEKKKMWEESTLQSAVDRNELGIVRKLLLRGENPNTQPEKGLPPLHSAATGGFVELGQLLIEHGADVNLPSMLATTDEEGKKMSKKGSTPLHFAVAFQQLPFGEMLIIHGAELNSLDGLGRTPLDIASGKGHVLERLTAAPATAQETANLEEQILLNRTMQEMLRKYSAKTTEELELARLEEEIERNKDQSLLGQSSARLKKSKLKAKSKADATGLQGPQSEKSRTLFEPKRGAPNVPPTERLNPLRPGNKIKTPEKATSS